MDHIRGREKTTQATAQQHPAHAGDAAAPGVGQKRRAEIIAATMSLITRDGVAGVPTRQIAREASVNLATLHYLFGSKDDLLLAVLDHATSALIAGLTLDANTGGGLWAAVAQSFAALATMLEHEPRLPLVRSEVVRYASRRPTHVAAAVQQHQRYVAALEGCYRTACADAESGVIPLDGLALLVSSGIDGLAMQITFEARAVAREHLLQALLALVQSEMARLRPQVTEPAPAGAPQEAEGSFHPPQHNARSGRRASVRRRHMPLNSA